jgi:hypothetical protein
MPWRETIRVLAVAVGTTAFILATYALRWF